MSHDKLVSLSLVQDCLLRLNRLLSVLGTHKVEGETRATQVALPSPRMQHGLWVWTQETNKQNNSTTSCHDDIRQGHLVI